MTTPHRHSLAVFALATAGACHQDYSVRGVHGGGGFTTIHGSGTLVEESRPVGAVTSVEHSSEGTLHVEQSAEEGSTEHRTLVTYAAGGSLLSEERTLLVEQDTSATLVVRAEDNLLPYLITEVHGDTLEIRTASGVDLQPTLPIEFFLRVASLDGVTLSGVGSIRIPDLTATSLSLTCTGVGSVEISDLQAVELDAVLGGFGEVRVSGDVERQTVRLNGFAPYRADDLESSEADVRVAGSGSATVRVRDLLVATVTSSGSVYYIGSPTVQATITGTGTVEQIGS